MVSVAHAIINIGRALNPRSVERKGSAAHVRLNVEHVQALLADWQRLDSYYRKNEALKYRGTLLDSTLDAKE